MKLEKTYGVIVDGLDDWLIISEERGEKLKDLLSKDKESYVEIDNHLINPQYIHTASHLCEVLFLDFQ